MPASISAPKPKNLHLRLLQGQKYLSAYPETTNQKRLEAPLMINVLIMKVKVVKVVIGYQSNNTLTIRPYLGDIINDLRILGERKIQLTTKMKFLPSKDDSESQLIHSKSDNIKIMIGVETDEIIGKLFNSLLHRHQIGLEQCIKGSDFLFDFADGLHNKCHKISLNRGRSYIMLLNG